MTRVGTEMKAILNLFGLSWDCLDVSWVVLGLSWSILISSTQENSKKYKKRTSFCFQNHLKKNTKSRQFWEPF